jgi:hypothetical protein
MVTNGYRLRNIVRAVARPEDRTVRKVVLAMMTTLNGRPDDPDAWWLGVSDDLYTPAADPGCSDMASRVVRFRFGTRLIT